MDGKVTGSLAYGVRVVPLRTNDQEFIRRLNNGYEYFVMFYTDNPCVWAAAEDLAAVKEQFAEKMAEDSAGPQTKVGTYPVSLYVIQSISSFDSKPAFIRENPADPHSAVSFGVSPDWSVIHLESIPMDLRTLNNL